MNFFCRFMMIGMLLLFPASSVNACGWWGDGEMDSDTEEVVIDRYGNVVTEDESDTSLSPMQMPGGQGFAIAMFDKDHTIPYRQASPDKTLITIKDLDTAGYKTVIDLGTPPHVATLHSAESETLAINYYNLASPSGGDADKTLASFLELLKPKESFPLMVYSMSVDDISRLWAVSRLALGRPCDQALLEVMRLGLSEEEAKALNVCQPE